MSLYFELLEKEEKYRLEEQSALLSSLLSNPSKGKLSILRRAGLAMTGLEVIGRGSENSARIIIELSPTVFNEESMKFGCFKPGEIVKIIVNGQLLNCIGTIERRNKSSNGEISVSLSNNLESEEMELLTEGSTKIALIKVIDEIGMFEKMKKNIQTVLNDKDGGDIMKFTGEFIEELKNKVNIEPTSLLTASLDNLKLDNLSRLNQEQEVAVKRSLEMFQDPKKHLILIHGPPGTGKTSVLIEILKQIGILKQKEQRKYKILILGPSNLSVDNIVERLGDRCGILRIGHPSRVLESCQRSTLDFWSENCDEGKLLKDVQKEIDNLVKNQLPKCKNREERRVIYGELKLLRQERKKREKTLQSDLIKRAEIVACTLSTACGKKLKGMKFDLAIIDEAGQALLPETLIAPILANKIIFAGDHCQLPPTVMNPLIKDQLEISLFEHLIKKRTDGDYIEVMLKEQYRMNERIMKWSNSKFYFNQLRAHESVSTWKLNFDCYDDEGCGDVLIFYDTCGFDLWESVEKSKDNKAALVLVEGKQRFIIKTHSFHLHF
jgi:DNA polymerase alpha-associated DNA helicase A